VTDDDCRLGYDREFLDDSREKPEMLPLLDAIGLEATEKRDVKVNTIH